MGPPCGGPWRERGSCRATRFAHQLAQVEVGRLSVQNTARERSLPWRSSVGFLSSSGLLTPARFFCCAPRDFSLSHDQLLGQAGVPATRGTGKGKPPGRPGSQAFVSAVAPERRGKTSTDKATRAAKGRHLRPSAQTRTRAKKTKRARARAARARLIWTLRRKRKKGPAAGVAANREGNQTDVKRAAL